MRYFASEDVATGLRGASLKFRKCPICWDSIQLSEVKPVRWYVIDDGLSEENILVASEPREGFDVAMRLFMRKQGATLSVPRDDYVALSQVAVIPEGELPWHYVPEVLHYAWMVKGSASYMKAEAEREIKALEQMEKEDETTFGEDGFWTQKAIQRIRDHSELYDAIGEGPVRQANVTLSTTPRKSDKQDSTDDTPYQYTQTPQPRENSYLFYQPRSGSHYYLSSLDIRILRNAFGDYDNFPSAILARVEHITSPHTVDDDFRRRNKYLSHLPSGCQISFLECDWSETVDPQVLETFIPEIERRRRARREKLIKEEREREIEERKKKFGRRENHLSQGFEDIVPTKDSEDVSWVIANALASAQAGTSTNLSTPSGSTVTPDSNVPRTVWGTPRVAVSPAAPATPQEAVAEDENEPGESGGMWTKNWEEMLKAESDRSDASKLAGPRKKKGKKLVLMSNSVQRGS
jgi:hypothetical protein